MLQTQQPLDLSLGGEMFFAVQNAQGETLYTRDGSFAASGGSEGNYVVNGQGFFVLDSSGQKITIDGSVSGISVSEDGTISFKPKAVEGEGSPAKSGSTAKLGIYDFKNPLGLNALGGNLFAKTAASGEPEAGKEPVVMQGYLESSNVDLTVEMTRLIRAQRAFSLASRALTTGDGMDGMVNQMR
jgi:flagellar basal-body rod protein FlgG